MKKLSLFLLALFSSLTIQAYKAYIDGIYYNFNGTEAIVTFFQTGDYNSRAYQGSVIIPESVTYDNKNYIVTCIGYQAFSNCTGVTSVTIPNSVTSIENNAFVSCTGLTSITIPNSVTSIGERAFSGCSDLISVTIGSGLISIGNFIFANCTSLTSISVEDGNTIYDSRNGCNSIIETATNTLIVGCKNTIIPNSVTNIGEYAFAYCTGLTSIIIPNSLNSIGDYAFHECTSLTSITIGSGLTSIGEKAFYNCIKLRHIFVASSTPADCGRSVFGCSTTYVRDNYDVYNYAVLHLPMGSKEEYAAAYEWRYFLKIKEDLDINGQVFYTTLSVNQAGDGYVQHYVKADEPYTLYFGSEEGMRINTVMFNGEDVTDRLIDGYYTTPNITRPSKIVVSYEQDPDGFAYVPSDSKLHIYGYEGSLFVSGIEEPQGMSVYTLDGKLTSTQTLEGDTKIKLNEGIYIVKVGERTFKVSL